MTTSLWRQYVLPFLLLVGLLAVATLAGDYALHRLGLVGVGRYLGIPGALIIAASFAYSARKRKWITVGNPRRLLRLHEFMAWFGSLLVLIHAGVHFSAALPWLATVAMGINVISGLVGKFLLDRSRRHVQGRRERLLAGGMSPTEVDDALHWDALMLGVMGRWRKVHIPIFVVFTTLALGHILGILLFWRWP